MHSHHSHSGQYCTHATGDLEDCVKEAVRQKFDLFCLTEHIPRYREADLYPGENVTLTDLMRMFREYHAHARTLQNKYSGKLEILVGLETEFIRDIDLSILELLIAKYPVDFVVGSVHHVNTIPVDFDKEHWEQALATCINEEAFYGTYFDHQWDVIKTLRPLVIGHMDVILLFAPEGTDLFQWPSVKDKIVRNIRYVVDYGGLFELNSAAFRKGWTTAYPKPNIVNAIKENRGHFCLSDDSHGPHQIGLNFDKLKGYLEEMGIGTLGRLRIKKIISDTVDPSKIHHVEVHTDPESVSAAEFLQWSTRTDL